MVIVIEMMMMILFRASLQKVCIITEVRQFHRHFQSLRYNVTCVKLWILFSCFLTKNLFVKLLKRQTYAKQFCQKQTGKKVRLWRGCVVSSIARGGTCLQV